MTTHVTAEKFKTILCQYIKELILLEKLKPFFCLFFFDALHFII